MWTKGTTKAKLIRTVFWVVALSALTVFTVSNISIITVAIGGIDNLSPVLTFSAGALALSGIANRGMLNRAAHQAVGLSASARSMTQTAAAGFAANKILRSGGSSGLAVFVRDGKRRGLDPSKVTAACLLAAASSLAGLAVLVAAAVAILAVTGQLNGWWIAAAAGLGIYATGTIVFVLVAARSRARVHQLFDAGRRLRMRLLRKKAESDHSTENGQNFADTFYDAFALARGNRRAIREVVAYGIASKTLGALMLYAAANAAGAQISLAGAVVIYATALVASFVSFTPGGVGAVEASMSAALVASGTSGSIALLAVAMFRLCDLWLPVAVGLYLGRRHEHTIAEPVETPSPLFSETAVVLDVSTSQLQPIPLTVSTR